MEKINKDFNVPYYIFEEILEYIELTAKGHCKSMKWNNIKSLINLAVLNNSLTKEQAEYLKKTFYRD